REEYIKDLSNGKTLGYTQKQKALTKTPYNMFESIYVDYPEFSANNKGLAIAALNTFIREKALEEVRNESFKYEFLPFAYHALATRLGNYKLDNWQSHSLETGSPIMQDIKTKLLFLSGDILAYQVQYQFFFEPHSNVKVEGMSYVKTYYLQLSSGKPILFKGLFDPNALDELNRFLQKEVNALLTENTNLVKSFYWETEGDLRYSNYGYEGGEVEGEHADNAEIQKVVLKAKDIDKFYLNLSPFSVQFILPPFSSSFEQFKQLGIVVNMPIEQFAKYVSYACPLGNWVKTSYINQTTIHDFNVLTKYRQGNYSSINPLEIENVFVQNPPKGVKVQELYFVQISKNDTQLELQRRTTYNAEGRIVKQAFGKEENPETWWHLYEYDTKGNVVTELQDNNNEIKALKTYTYNANNCLKSSSSLENGEAQVNLNYYYKDSFVYECKEVKLFEEMSEVEASEVKVYALDAYQNIVSSYALSETPNYITRFDKDKRMASYSLKYPNLDNGVYAYSKEGNLETIIMDNGRRLYTYSYQGNHLLLHEQYDGYSLQEKREYYYDAEWRLIGFKEMGRNGNRERSYSIKYQY
ncbi:MAG: hypothetical protein K9J84_14985, partial [Bacteroidia bacterium]|nr:hypothetical protein [Bacteroidia bacterium]